MSEEQDESKNIDITISEKPKTPTKLVFVTTFDGHIKYDIEDEKVWIKDNKLGEVSRKLKDITLDDRYIYIGPLGNPLVEKADHSFLNFITLFKTILLGKNDHLITEFPAYFVGDSIYNFCINPEYLQHVNQETRSSIVWNMYYLFDSTFDTINTEGPKVRIYSFNLVQQFFLCPDNYLIRYSIRIWARPPG